MIERTQPVVSGVDEKGELVWVRVPMARWQMEMFRVTVNWFGEFFSRWLELAKHDEIGRELGPEGSDLGSIKTASKERIEELKRMYIRPKMAWKHNGD